MACPKIPNLDVKLEAAPDTNECTPDPEKAVVNCPEIMVKFGEVEITQTIELGYSLLDKQPTHLIATRKGQASYDFKFSKPKYFAGSLVQIHDFFAATPIISAPETVTRKVLTAPKKYVDLKLFKQAPWEHFGCTTTRNLKEGWDFGNNDYNKNIDWLGAPIYDFAYNPADLEGIGSTSQSLRQNYLREANVLLGEKGVLITQEQKDKFKNYFNSKALEAVDYTNEMRILYALAATGQLPYDVFTRKYRIGNSKTNPGYDRTVKIVLNLYVRILRAEMASNAGSVLKEVKLDGAKYREAAVNHKKKSCLKVIVALNGEDTGETESGTYYFGTVWGKADANQTFSKLLEDAPDKPAHGAGTGKSPGKTTAMAYKDGYKVQSDFTGEELKKAKPDFVVFENDLNPWKTRVVNKLNVINFWREERRIAGARLYEWELREKTGQGQYTPVHKNLWGTPEAPYAQPGRTKAVRIESPKVKTLADGIEVTPGLVLYVNSGPNVHMGSIAGSSFQTHMVFPLEAFSVFIDEGQYGQTTLETLPGKFMNFFSMGVLVAHWNVVQTVNDGATLYNNYIKAERLKEAAEKMKKYAEEVRAQMHRYVDALSQALRDRDIAKYNQILGSMKELAADFARKTGYTIPLDRAIQGGKDLQTFIDASNQLINPPTPPGTPNPEPPPTPTPDRDDPTPQGPETTDLTPPAGGPSSALVIDGLIGSINPGGATTSLPIDPVVFTPAFDTPQLGSTYNLGNIGHSEQTGPGFDQVGLFFKNIPGFDTNANNNVAPFSWDIGDQ